MTTHGTRPDRETMAELARHHTGRQLARIWMVAETTARRWLREEKLSAAPVDMRERQQSSSPLYRFHGGDIEAMKRDIRGTELGAMAARFQRQVQSIYKWERELEVHCRRICIDCRVEFPYEQIAARKDGRSTCRCIACAEVATGKPSRAMEEPQHSKDPAIAALRLRMSPAEGPVAYWQAQGLWMMGAE